jgi:phenylalanyl-tRNA synthetase alpha chain
MTDPSALKTSLLTEIDAAADLAALEAVRVSALGKKGPFAEAMKTLASLPTEERKAFGAAVNTAKDEVTAALDARKETLGLAALNARLEFERIDITLPVRAARPDREGTIHPVSQTIDEVIAIFADMGFALAEGPDIEDDFHNFEALNFAPDHPARQMHDTFYLPPDADGKTRLLRTHTSPVQIRTMQSVKPPIRVITPGRTYRSDYDQTHTPMFHQVEALVIDEHASMANLRATVLEFCRAFFQIDDLPVRFRPSFFPFTEPSAEVDIGCDRSGGGLKLGNFGDWLEILGCGMVHPNVLKNCGIDPERYQGFALGMGIDRIAMLKYGIPDLRSFFESDLRWLRHYGFAALAQPSLATGL